MSFRNLAFRLAVQLTSCDYPAVRIAIWNTQGAMNDPFRTAKNGARREGIYDEDDPGITATISSFTEAEASYDCLARANASEAR